jgi:hypothetical protein
MEDKQENQEQKNPVGRPSCYRDKYAQQAYKLALLGATDKELAYFFEVAESTINEWKKAFPEFSESIKRGKIQADAEVAEKLYHRAKGYSHPEVKVFCQEGEIITHEVVKHYPPDTGAAMAWLKNRRRKSDLPWQDSHDITSGGEKIEPKIVSFLDATKPPEKHEQPESTDDNTE